MPPTRLSREVFPDWWIAVNCFFAAGCHEQNGIVEVYADPLGVGPAVISGPADDAAGALMKAVGGAEKFGRKIFSPVEQAVIDEAGTIINSSDLTILQTAYEAGEEGVQVVIGGRTIQYEPSIPGSGFSMFGENGFLLGPEAFATGEELTKTVLQELYRLEHSVLRRAGEGLSGALARSETDDAFGFAERAYDAFFRAK